MKITFRTKKLAIIIAIISAVVILLSFIFVPMLKNNTVALESQNFKITADMMSYLVNEELNNYIDYHTASVGDNYLDIVKLDKDKNLKKQKSVYGGSWFDYFYKLAEKRAKEILLVCEDAKNLNINLNDAEQKEIDSLIKKTNISDLDISKKNLKTILQYLKIAEKHRNNFISSLDEADYEKYYQQNRNEFDCVDYKCIVVSADIEQNKTNGQSVDDLVEAASKRAEKLKEEIVKEGFDKPVNRYLKEIKSQQTIEDLTFTSQRYIKGMQYTEWAFDEQRKAGDVIVFSGTYQFSIYYLEKTPYPYDYQLNDGIIAYGDYDASNPRFQTELKEKIESQVKNDADLVKFISDNKFKQLTSVDMYKENLPSHVSQWFYSVDKKVGDLEVCIYGKSIYIMKYNGPGISYFTDTLNSKCQEDSYKSKIDELSKIIKVKG